MMGPDQDLSLTLRHTTTLVKAEGAGTLDDTPAHATKGCAVEVAMNRPLESSARAKGMLMMDLKKIKHIWNPGTGITDIETDWRSISASEIDSIQKIWSEQRSRLRGTKQLAEFSER